MSNVHNFCHRLHARDPRAINALRKLGGMHRAGNAEATTALHEIAACMASIRLGAMYSGQSYSGQSFVGSPFSLVTKPLAWVTKTAGKVLSTTGNLAEHAGKLAAVPFHWGGTHLQNVATHGVKMPHLMLPHLHIP